jgi:hypothetical protein
MIILEVPSIIGHPQSEGQPGGLGVSETLDDFSLSYITIRADYACTTHCKDLRPRTGY